MSRVCALCNKGRVSGNSVSHSHIKTRRAWNANVHKTKSVDENGHIVSQYVCTRCLRTKKKDAE